MEDKNKIFISDIVYVDSEVGDFTMGKEYVVTGTSKDGREIHVVDNRGLECAIQRSSVVKKTTDNFDLPDSFWFTARTTEYSNTIQRWLFDNTSIRYRDGRPDVKFFLGPVMFAVRNRILYWVENVEESLPEVVFNFNVTVRDFKIKHPLKVLQFLGETYYIDDEEKFKKMMKDAGYGKNQRK